MGGSVLRQRLRMLLVPSLLLIGACAAPVAPVRSSESSHLGFPFPSQVASFTLQDVHEYDDALLGAAATYRLSRTDSLLVSVYAYPTPRFEDGSLQALDDHARDELIGILDQYAGAQQIDWPYEMSEEERRAENFRQAAIEITDREVGTFHSLLRIVDYGDARLKFRISYPPAHKSAVPEVRRFMNVYPGR